MKRYWIDKRRTIIKTYDDVIKDINNKKNVRKFINSSNPYEIYLEILCSILQGGKYEVLDSNFSANEILNLNINIEEIDSLNEITFSSITDVDNLIYQITTSKKDWRIGFYTSGTTGRPKKVFHSLQSLIRNVKNDEKFKKDIWGFCYNSTHIAGFQVFFQAFLNENPMIYLFESSGQEINDELNQNLITNISATPTFYRTFLPYIVNPILSIKVVTFGGELFDPTLIDSVKRKFPNARVLNIYASTEIGSLFASENNIFHIPQQYEDSIKINPEGELLIKRTLLGDSIDCVLDGDWFHTGDLVEKIDDRKFKFISRKSEMINVAGYKVNPNEIEFEIKKIEGVRDVVIKARSNRITGNILLAEIIKESHIEESELEERIRQQLTNNLQAWKIPRIIHFVENFEKARTGKKVR
jgi:acyl-coenzyme A synthetase/AMP-(fatty) acid ligase